MMSTEDRGLLMRAAKKAGIEHAADRLECGLSLTMADGRHLSLPQWNPLEDDGDAFRLAVTLSIDIEREGAVVFADGNFSEPANEDPLAATRRAVVRAAAYLGWGL